MARSEAERPYGLFVLENCTVDNIIEIEGTFPIEGNASRGVERIHLEPGGEGNLLILFQRLGGRSLPVGPVCKDAYGEFLLGSFRKEGIETRYLVPTEGCRATLATCVIDQAGVHTFLSKMESSSFAGMESATDTLELCQGFFLSGYDLFDETLPFFSLSLRLLEHARRRRIPVFFDSGPFVEKIPREVLRQALEGAAVISLNQREAESVAGTAGVERAGRAIAAKVDGLVIVKSGGKGCFIVSGTEEGRWYPGFTVPEVDSMGCGDSFFAAFIYAYLLGCDLETCATLANAAGAVKMSKRGTGTQVPRFEEMAEFLERNGFSIPQEQKDARCFRALSLHRDSPPDPS